MQKKVRFFICLVVIIMIVSCSSLFEVEKIKFSGTLGHHQDALFVDSLDTLHIRSYE